MSKGIAVTSLQRFPAVHVVPRPLRVLGVVVVGTLCATGMMARTPTFAAAPVECPGMALTLSGGTSASAVIPVDDDLDVKLNGISIFVDNDELAQNLPPIKFTGAAFGDELRVIASNSTVYGGGETIGPLYLHCDANGQTQVLDAVGVINVSGAQGHVFYDRTFVINFTAPAATTTTTTTAPTTTTTTPAPAIVVQPIFTG